MDVNFWMIIAIISAVAIVALIMSFMNLRDMIFVRNDMDTIFKILERMYLKEEKIEQNETVPERM